MRSDVGHWLESVHVATGARTLCACLRQRMRSMAGSSRGRFCNAATGYLPTANAPGSQELPLAARMPLRRQLSRESADTTRPVCKHVVLVSEGGNAEESSWRRAGAIDDSEGLHNAF